MLALSAALTNGLRGDRIHTSLHPFLQPTQPLRHTPPSKPSPCAKRLRPAPTSTRKEKPSECELSHSRLKPQWHYPLERQRSARSMQTILDLPREIARAHREEARPSSFAGTKDAHHRSLPFYPRPTDAIVIKPQPNPFALPIPQHKACLNSSQSVTSTTPS